MNKASAVRHYGDIVAVFHDGSALVHSLSPLNKLHEVHIHPNNRGVIVRGDYGLPVIVSNAELTETNLFSGPTLVQKKPEVGDRVIYYPGNGKYAIRWAIDPPKKPGSYPGKAIASS